MFHIFLYGLKCCYKRVLKCEQYDHFRCVDVESCSSALSDILPGGVTIVLPRKQTLNPALNPTYPTVGVRVPDHTFILELCAALGAPIALTSANRSSGPNSTSIEVFI